MQFLWENIEIYLYKGMVIGIFLYFVIFLYSSIILCEYNAIIIGLFAYIFIVLYNVLQQYRIEKGKTYIYFASEMT